MTQRLYYTDAYLTGFTASVTEVLDVDGRAAVVLDRTAFYPTSGGQPFDTGVLNGVGVAGVVDLTTAALRTLSRRPLRLGTR